jgi:hypothetical protein
MAQLLTDNRNLGAELFAAQTTGYPEQHTPTVTHRYRRRVIASTPGSLCGHRHLKPTGNIMIRNPNTESTQFIQSLKVAGVAISKENEVIERLEEAREWHYAFTTLVKQGKRIGISFLANPGIKSAVLQRLFAQYRFADNAEATFEACLLH